MTKLIYIASPYWHPKSCVRKHRVELSAEYAGVAMMHGDMPFSPLAHSLGMIDRGVFLSDESQWLKLDLAILERCDEMHVLALPGWLQSFGVQVEIYAAEQAGMTIRYIDSGYCEVKNA